MYIGDTPGAPYVGQRVWLISNADIRYEGTLYSMDLEESTLTLQNVRSLGSEPGSSQKIPPSSEIYESVVFSATRIKDMGILDSPTIPQPMSQMSLPHEFQTYSGYPGMIPQAMNYPHSQGQYGYGVPYGLMYGAPMMNVPMPQYPPSIYQQEPMSSSFQQAAQAFQTTENAPAQMQGLQEDRTNPKATKTNLPSSSPADRTRDSAKAANSQTPVKAANSHPQQWQKGGEKSAPQTLDKTSKELQPKPSPASRLHATAESTAKPKSTEDGINVRFQVQSTQSSHHHQHQTPSASQQAQLPNQGSSAQQHARPSNYVHQPVSHSQQIRHVPQNQQTPKAEIPQQTRPRQRHGYQQHPHQQRTHATFSMRPEEISSDFDFDQSNKKLEEEIRAIKEQQVASDQSSEKRGFFDNFASSQERPARPRGNRNYRPQTRTFQKGQFQQAPREINGS